MLLKANTRGGEEEGVVGVGLKEAEEKEDGGGGGGGRWRRTPLALKTKTRRSIKGPK